MGVAIGVGVAMLLRPKATAVVPSPTTNYPTIPSTLPSGNRSRGDVLSGPLMRRRSPRMGNYIKQPGYPMPGWYANNTM